MRNIIRAVLFFVVKLVMIEAKLTCQPLDDDALSLVVTSDKGCEEYTWKTYDGTVVAHEEDFNKTLVLRMEHVSGQYNITFMTCQSNVSFICDKETISCENLCPVQIRSPGPPQDHRRADKPSREHFGIIGSVLVVIFVLIVVAVISTIWKMFKQN